MSIKHKKTNLSSRIKDLREMGFSYCCIQRVLPSDMQVSVRTLHRYMKGGNVQSWKIERELNNVYLVLYNLILENKIGEFDADTNNQIEK